MAPPTSLEGMEVPSGYMLVPVWVCMDIVRDEMANRSVTKNVTLPAWLNKQGMKHKINFSNALQERLGI